MPILKENNLHQTEVDIMLFLNGTSGKTSSEIANFIGLSVENTYVVLHRLGEKGFIEAKKRRIIEGEGLRTKLYTLTSDGLSVMKQMERMLTNKQQTIEDPALREKYEKWKKRK